MTMLGPENDIEADPTSDYSHVTEHQSRTSRREHASTRSLTNGQEGKCTDMDRLSFCVTKDSATYSVNEVLVRQDSASASDSDVSDICEKLGSKDFSLQNGSSIFDGDSILENVTIIGNDVCFDDFEKKFSIDFGGHDLYSKDKDGDTKLHIAIICLRVDLALSIIEKAPTYRWLSLRNKMSQSPLHLAVLTRLNLVVRKLMTSGADILSRDKTGNTPLHLACREGMVEIVQSLLRRVEFHEALQNSYDIPFQNVPKNLSLLNYDGLSCLHLASSNRHYDVIELLISQHVDLNVKEGKTGRTILHNACLDGDIPLVRMLLKLKSCNINARAYDGLTPFDIARARRRVEICTILAAAGAVYGREDDSD